MKKNVNDFKFYIYEKRGVLFKKKKKKNNLEINK